MASPMLQNIEMSETHVIDPTSFHYRLAELNFQKFSIQNLVTPDEEMVLDSERHLLETPWIETERVQVQRYLKDMPQDPEQLISWLEKLQLAGPGQHHPLFDFLSKTATVSDFEFFMGQELATEAGFDDLVAMTQVQAPHQAKLELAKNYWDELGNGSYEKMHSVQLGWVAQALDLKNSTGQYANSYWQALALSNMMLAFASRRCYFYHSIGALGAIEMTAPLRCAKITEGLKRLGFSNCQYRYYALHAVLDVKHWHGWRDNILRPLLEEHPESRTLIAEGFLLRMIAGLRCYDAYWTYFQKLKARELTLVS